MAFCVCAILCLFFYLTYFMKMHDGTAKFLILLEYAPCFHVPSLHSAPLHSRCDSVCRHMIFNDLSRW